MPEFPKLSKGFHPFAELIGLDFITVKRKYSQCKIEVKEELFNPHKVVHGGVMYSMVDTGMGGALYPSLGEGELCATLEIKINYFKPVSSGTLICDTKLINKGKSNAVLESEITNNEKLVAKAIGTYSIFKINKG